MAFYTLPFSESFIPFLARRLLAEEDLFILAQTRVFLPTRRACLALEQELIRLCPYLLLPKMIPLGEEGEGETLSQSRRQVILTQLILKFLEQHSFPFLEPQKAADLALELMSFLDEVETEGISLEGLNHLVPDDYATYWKITLDFLQIIRIHWPEILGTEKGITSASQRRQHLESLAQSLQNCPFPVIAAGSTGSIPATGNLLATIGHLPRGEVILPGLDIHVKDVPASHPQYTMHQFLKRHDIDPSSVRALASCSLKDEGISAIFENREAFLPHVRLAEVRTSQEEAQVIAIAMREILESPDKTALLITPDRSLAEAVSLELERWKIRVDDSGGKPFSDTPTGIFVRLTGNPKISMTEVLSLLKHPFTQGPEGRLEFNIRLRTLEKKARGSPLFSLDSLDDPWIQAVLLRWKTLQHSGAVPFLKMWKAHTSFISFLYPKPIYSAQFQEENRVFQEFWNELETAAADLILPDGSYYLPFLESLMKPLVVRPPRASAHPRLTILGAMEARLMRADLMILGGLNEGTWPRQPTADPWFNEAMRNKLGLPSREKRVGLSAHDFCQGLAGHDVLITRSSLAEGIPSRFLMRIKTFSNPIPAHDLLGWQHHLDQSLSSEKKVYKWRAPCPPLSFRPRHFSVTDVGILVQNPYAFYAKKILKLIPLHQKLSPSLLFGLMIHTALQKKEPGKEPWEEIFMRYFKDIPDAPLWKIRAALALSWDFTYGDPVWREVRGELTLDTPGVTLTAIADCIDKTPDGLRILDYKTGQIPSMQKIKWGYAPQLPLEAAILRYGKFEGIPFEEKIEMAYVHLTAKGGEYLPLKSKEDLVENALQGFLRLVDLFDRPTTPYVTTGYALAPYDHLSRFGLDDI